MDERWKRAQWIAEELGEDPEDVYDVLLGNITEPRELVTNVESLSHSYDNQKQRFLH